VKLQIIIEIKIVPSYIDSVQQHTMKMAVETYKQDKKCIVGIFILLENELSFVSHWYYKVNNKLLVIS